MRPVKIFADSTCDLPPDLIRQYQVGIVPLYVIFGEHSYRDRIDITPDTLFRMVQETGSLPKTAAPSPSDFQQAFEPVIAEGYDILYIALSSSLSSTRQNARIAGSFFEEGRVRVFDSLNLCNGIGIQVVKAARAALDGKDLDAIEAMLHDIRPRVETSFVIDTLDYLYMGGRCSSVQNFIGNMLKIRPVVQVVDGGMILAEKIRGKREKAIGRLLDRVLVNKDAIDREIMFVPQAEAPEEAAYLKERLKAELDIREVVIAEAGCVISSHCGPQTVGIIYLNK